jgi:urea transport system permease protein
MTHILIRSLDRSATIFLLIVAAVGVVVPLLNLLFPPSSIFHVPTYLVALFGKYLCSRLI